MDTRFDFYQPMADDDYEIENHEYIYELQAMIDACQETLTDAPLGWSEIALIEMEEELPYVLQRYDRQIEAHYRINQTFKSDAYDEIYHRYFVQGPVEDLELNLHGKGIRADGPAIVASIEIYEDYMGYDIMDCESECYEEPEAIPAVLAKYQYEL